MNQASEEGALSRQYGSCHKRWSQEWLRYVEDYKKKHGIVIEPWE